MPTVEWIENGYQGFTLPQAELLTKLLFDYRYGLFVTCPLFLLSLLSPLWNRGRRRVIPHLEFLVFLGLPVGLWLFCGGISYTRLQFNSGLRYLAPLLPFLFVPAAIVFQRLVPRAQYFIAAAAITEAWCMAMYRDVERGLGALDPLAHIFTGGFQLPVLTVLSRLTQYADYTGRGVSPLPLFALTGAAIYGIWAFGAGSSARPAREPEAAETAAAAGRH
jgi:hypothetical protein